MNNSLEIRKLIYDEFMSMRLEVVMIKDIKDVDKVLAKYHEQVGKKVAELLKKEYETV